MVKQKQIVRVKKFKNWDPNFNNFREQRGINFLNTFRGWYRTEPRMPK